jgi:hypothetical protein
MQARHLDFRFCPTPWQVQFVIGCGEASWLMVINSLLSDVPADLQLYRSSAELKCESVETGSRDGKTRPFQNGCNRVPTWSALALAVSSPDSFSQAGAFVADTAIEQKEIEHPRRTRCTARDVPINFDLINLT